MGATVLLGAMFSLLTLLLLAHHCKGEESVELGEGRKLYYEENGAKFYGIPVAEGSKLTEGVVADTCEAVGMRAVCAGNYNCRWSSNRCQVVDFEAKICGYTMYGLAKKVCGKRNPRYCKQLDGLFANMKGFKGGECGVIDGKYCVDGKSYTSGNPTLYYAYCVDTSTTFTIADDKTNLDDDSNPDDDSNLVDDSNQVDDSNLVNDSNLVDDSNLDDDSNPDDVSNVDRNSNLYQAEGRKLYCEENGAKFYGIPVAEGAKLTEGVVADTCEAVGMRAVCAGNYNCRWSSNRCQVVDFEAKICGYTMYGLAEKVCGERNPRYCKQLNGLFAHLKGYNGGECGIINGQYCVNGKSYTSGNPTLYYAYCVSTNISTNADDSFNVEDTSNLDDDSNLDENSNQDDYSNLGGNTNLDDKSNQDDYSNLDDKSNQDDYSNLENNSNQDDFTNLDDNSSQNNCSNLDENSNQDDYS